MFTYEVCVYKSNSEICMCELRSHTVGKKVERIGRVPFHGVAALSAFGIEQGNPFRDGIESILIDLDG